MPLFGGLFGTDQILKQLSHIQLRLQQFEDKVMADFTSLDKAIADLGVEVAEIIDLLTTGDTADQANVDAAVAKLTALKDAIDAATPDPPTP